MRTPPTGHPRRRWSNDHGIATAGVLVALALSLIAVVALINAIVYQYGRGAVRSAIDQAARAGSRASASAAACEERARETVDVLLGGPLGDDLTITCTDDGRYVRATATGTFHGWLAIVPDWSWSITATATKEHAP